MDTIANRPIKKTKGRGKKILRTLLLFFLLGLAVFVYWRYYFTYSDGDRFGLLQKFSHKGNVFKTYEGEMILSSIQSNANIALASEKFYFSVTDKNIAGQLMKLQGHHVTVHYKQKNGKLPWRGESEYLVDSVLAEQ